MTNPMTIGHHLTVQECYERLSLKWLAIETDFETGEAKVREMPALLLELREAVFGGMESAGGRAGFRPRMPISDGALDLYQTIDQEIAEVWAEAHPGQIPNAETPERLLSQVVAARQPDDVFTIVIATQRVDNRGTHQEHWHVDRSPAKYTLEELMRRWVRQITEFFNPLRTREIKAPCLQCGEEWGWKNTDGEDRPFRVFVFIQDDHGNTLEARCLACDMSWGRDKFVFLAAALDTPRE